MWTATVVLPNGVKKEIKQSEPETICFKSRSCTPQFDEEDHGQMREIIHSLTEENKKLKHDLSFVQEENDNLKANVAAQKTENLELVAEIERYAEVIDQLKSEISVLKETIKTKHTTSRPRPSGEKKSSPKKSIQTNDEIFLSKSIGSAEDVCAALNSFVQNHSSLLMPNNTNLSSWFEDKPTATATIEIKEPVVSKPSASNDAWSFPESKQSSVRPESPINPENLISMLFTNQAKEIPVKKSGHHKSSSSKSHSGSGASAAIKRPSPPPISEEENEIVRQLQERVQKNIYRLGNRALKTGEVAKQAKRLMTAYNIGQRLFAKHVMNRVVKSQGSLSELLSKPREWHKHTDKGREAFRRLFGWICDDKAIELLCSLSPRRVSMPCDKVEHPDPESLIETFGEPLSPLPSFESIPDLKPEDFQKNFIVNSPTQSPPTANVTTTIPIDIITTPTLVNQQNKEPMLTPPTTSRNNSRWRHDDIPKEKIIDILEAEKAKLREQETNIEKAMNESVSPTPSLKMNGGTKSPQYSRENSPSSFMSNCKSEPLAIQQEQIDKYNLLNTENLVKQVKDFLSRHSISQRQFGEKVLGLSQGSVSDLLARPKAWAMLTQKGREPFIRMKIFLDECSSFQPKDGEETEELEFERAPSPEVQILSVTGGPMKEIKVEPESEVGTGDFELKLNPSQIRLLGRSGIDPSSLTSDSLSALENVTVGQLLKKALPFHDSSSAVATLVTTPTTTGSKRKSITPDEEFVVPAKRIPRFQRTVITDKQKEALYFIYQYEPRPSTSVIEQLAQKLGLSSRTVTNWFHNHRTRQKAKETKMAKDGIDVAAAMATQANKDPATQEYLQGFLEIVKAAKDAAAAANSSNQNHHPPIGSLSNNSFDSIETPESPTKEAKKEDEGNNSEEDPTASALEKALNKIHARAALKT
uniref:DNA-binding protein SATB n=1 Tax=Panagrolaimus sp. JU765 TaxID=591449 RepID=A0AC34R2Y2_9BILA